jgi:hypothetical protein
VKKRQIDQASPSIFMANAEDLDTNENYVEKMKKIMW